MPAAEAFDTSAGGGGSVYGVIAKFGLINCVTFASCYVYISARFLV